MYSFVLYLYCLTCSPVQVMAIHNIPLYDNSTSQWADITCKAYGDLLTGKLAELNGEVSMKKQVLAYKCVLETKEF